MQFTIFILFQTGRSRNFSLCYICRVWFFPIGYILVRNQPLTTYEFLSPLIFSEHFSYICLASYSPKNTGDIFLSLAVALPMTWPVTSVATNSLLVYGKYFRTFSHSSNLQRHIPWLQPSKPQLSRLAP